MRSLLGMAVFCALAGAMVSAEDRVPAANSKSPEDVRFPDLTFTNLEKQTLSMPHDFEGERNLLLIAFQREQQDEVDTWLREMKRFEEMDPGFRYYELPIIEKLNGLTRWFINRGMRRGIPDKKARERTITLYLDKSAFRQSLALRDEKRIYAVLVDRSGRVLWRAEGTFDEAKAASLKESLQRQPGNH